MKWTRIGSGWYEATDTDGRLWRVALEWIPGRHKPMGRVVLRDDEAPRPWLRGAPTNHRARSTRYRPDGWVRPPLAHTHLTWVIRCDGVRVGADGEPLGDRMSAAWRATHRFSLSTAKAVAEKAAGSKSAASTASACHGCGRVGTGRRLDSVCDNCRSHLDGFEPSRWDQASAHHRAGVREGKTILGALASGVLTNEEYDLLGVASAIPSGVGEKVKGATALDGLRAEIEDLQEQLELAGAEIERLRAEQAR